MRGQTARMNNWPRWKLSDLMLLILAFAIGLAAYRVYWKPSPDPNARPILSAYLAVLTLASLGSFVARPRWRRPYQGFALFGWCNLVFVVWCGFWLSTIYDAERVVVGCELGILLGLLCALLAGWLFEPACDGANREPPPQ